MSFNFTFGIVSALLLCCCATEYKEAFFDQRIDHFNFESFGDQTFKHRYLYNDTWWERGRGPIFFYTGNEDSIELFWQNCGFIMEIAESRKALILFAEHRYYGKSLPFGNNSFVNPMVSWMSVEQTLADYAFLIRAIKKEFKAENCPVIAFGGSYGGLLAAYMRFKYPNIIQGSIAASAPIYLFAGLTSGDLFYQAITKVYHDASENCESNVRNAFRQLDKWASSGQTGLGKISQAFRLCSPLKQSDYEQFLLWIRNAFFVSALMNYPYPTSFVGKYPAYPVKVICEQLAAESVPASGLAFASSLCYNSSGHSECFDIYKEYPTCADITGCGMGTDSKAWDYLSCTELNSEGGTDGKMDMFPVLPFNSSMRDEHCLKTWGVLPRRDLLDVQFWGKDISSASNIVFSNGDLDPCTTGGVLKNITDSVVSVLIKDGAHHLDLRASNAADPQSVKDARNFELRNIDKWVDEFYMARGL